MPNVTHFVDEAPTRPSEDVPSRTLIRWARVARLAELSLERLSCAPDADSITAAIVDLETIRLIAQEQL